MALFIEVEFDPSVAADVELAKKLVEVCPVNIFELGKTGKLQTVEANLDECTLCELCLNAAPTGTVRVRRLYGAKEVLERRT